VVEAVKATRHYNNVWVGVGASVMDFGTVGPDTRTNRRLNVIRQPAFLPSLQSMIKLKEGLLFELTVGIRDSRSFQKIR
jgi:hypothetical protein